MRKVLLVLLFALFFLPAAAQQYYITEAQLQRLETISQNYKALNQMLQEQLEKSQSKVQSLQTESETLQTQLAKERETTKSLNQSLAQYEIKNSQSEAEKMQLILDLEAQKAKTHKWFVLSMLFALLNIFFISFIILYAYIRLRV